MTAARLAILLLLLSGLARADSFLPAGAFSYEQTRLDNGLRIVVQRVHSAPYVSARLVTRTGTGHFSCENRELPHLVEHLLFSANAQLEESRIDDQVTAWGGTVNAFTYPAQTDVVLDVHAQFQAEAMQLLATMIHDFAPQADDVEREKLVVERESGVAHSPFRLWWSAQPFTQRALTAFGIDAGLDCPQALLPVQHLTVDDVRTAFTQHYVPANMILVLVGDLTDDGIAAARAAFSALPARPAPALPPQRIAMPAEHRYVSGWLSGAAHQGEPAAAGISPFTDWEGYYAMLLVESWLNDRMFRELRSERGIAYTPDVGVEYQENSLLTVFSIGTEPADTAYVMQYLQALTDEVRTQGIPEQDFERMRISTLLGMAQAFERISDRADYLAASMREIDSGALFDSERFYQQLDYPRFRALVARDWPARFAIMDNSPRLPWGVLMALLAGSCGLLVLGVTLFVWRRLPHRQKVV